MSFIINRSEMRHWPLMAICIRRSRNYRRKKTESLKSSLTVHRRPQSSSTHRLPAGFAKIDPLMAMNPALWRHR